MQVHLKVAGGSCQGTTPSCAAGWRDGGEISTFGVPPRPALLGERRQPLTPISRWRRAICGAAERWV